MSPVRERILEAAGSRDVRAEDDGTTFTFTYAPGGAPPTVLRWTVDDATLHDLRVRGAREARTAWGTRRADGLFFVLTRLEALLHTFEGPSGVVVLRADGGLDAVPAPS